jgi:hypothetical protein
VAGSEGEGLRDGLVMSDTSEEEAIRAAALVNCFLMPLRISLAVSAMKTIVEMKKRRMETETLRRKMEFERELESIAWRARLSL